MSVFSKAYKFTLLDGAVTAVYRIQKGRTRLEDIDSDESWSIDGENIVRIESENGQIETTVFADTNRDGIYYQIAKSTSATKSATTTNPAIPNQKGYRFDLTDGLVTAVFEIERGVARLKPTQSDETWLFEAGQVIKTEAEHGVIETSVYTDQDGDGVFQKVSSAHVLADGTAWTGQAGSDGDDVWSGTTNDDRYHGGHGNDRLAGGDGDDDVYGADGDDVMKGDAGADRLDGGSGKDSLHGEEGADRMEGGPDSDILDGGMGNDYLNGGDAPDLVQGGAGDDELIGEAGDDRLLGDAGTDRLLGGEGNDKLTGGDGADHIEGGLDRDSLDGGLGDDLLNGGDAQDWLIGGHGHDDLYGEDGEDLLTGGMGSDDLYGGAGSDIFKLTSPQDSGMGSSSFDRIFDFSVGDRIDLSAIDARSGNWRNDAFAYIESVSRLTRSNANGALWFDRGFLYGSTDRDTAPEFKIELIGITQFDVAAVVL